ncbi:MAG: hypothetical protein NTV05_07540 [Acidobacteria bacterium]|nr:hypothetical protein [Acidobacteriota bacterium]
MPETVVVSRPVTARTTLETAEKWDPELKLALVQLEASQTVQRYLDVADAYCRLGIADKAVDHLNRALQVDRGSAAAYDRLARVWRDAGLPQFGLADGHRAAYYAPASPEAQNTLGTILQALGLFRAARDRYRMALTLDPGAAYALNNLCSLDLLDGNPARAVTVCGQALAITPGLVVARQNLAWAEAMLALAKAGNPDARH